MVEIVVTDEFKVWYEELPEDRQESVAFVVGLLADRGVALSFPYSSAIKGSRHALRELRVQARGDPYRVLYVFDPKRQALLLLGGSKAGRDRFYEEEVPRADVIYDQYLREQK